MESVVCSPTTPTMPLFSQQIVANLGPTNLDGYVELILRERRDDVISELGLTRVEIPFFIASSNLSRLLVLNKLYEVHLTTTNTTDKHDPLSYCPSALLQQELSSLMKDLKLKHAAYHSGNNALRLLDLSYTPNGMSTSLLREHKDVQGLGITLHSVATSTAVQRDPHSWTQFTVCNVDVRSVEAAQREISSKCRT